jgi:hypothetical protein
MPDIDHLKRIASIEFADIVRSVRKLDYKLRIILINNSFIDVHVSTSIPGKFGFHWETRDSQGSIYRYDNFPDHKWKSVRTFPYHFHNGTQERVEASPFPLDIVDGFRGFLEFVKGTLK